jgi:hypothetical protein
LTKPAVERNSVLDLLTEPLNTAKGAAPVELKIERESKRKQARRHAEELGVPAKKIIRAARWLKGAHCPLNALYLDYKLEEAEELLGKQKRQEERRRKKAAKRAKSKLLDRTNELSQLKREPHSEQAVNGKEKAEGNGTVKSEPVEN